MAPCFPIGCESASFGTRFAEAARAVAVARRSPAETQTGHEMQPFWEHALRARSLALRGELSRHVSNLRRQSSIRRIGRPMQFEHDVQVESDRQDCHTRCDRFGSGRLRAEPQGFRDRVTLPSLFLRGKNYKWHHDRESWDFTRLLL